MSNCRQTIIDLARGSSVQAKAANTYWIALIIVALTSIVAGFNVDQDGKISLPFDLGLVPESYFHMMSLVIMAGLGIAYTNAHIEVSRTKKLIGKLMEELGRNEQGKGEELREGRHLEDILNSSITPNVGKVASIGLYFDTVFKEGSQRATRWKCRIYFALKVVSWVFSYGIPLAAMFLCSLNMGIAFTPNLIGNIAITVLTYAVGVFGFGALLLMLFVDWRWTREKCGKWRSGQSHV